jgi:hypothetical protein
VKPPAVLRTLARDARDAFVHAPVEVLLGIAVAASFSWMLRGAGDRMDEWAPIFVAAVIALPLVFAASVLRARGVIPAAARWCATALALAAGAAYAAWGLDVHRGAEVWRAASLAGAAWLVLPLAAFPGSVEGRRRRVWRFGALLVARMLTVGLYGAALFAALAGAVAAVASLFELSPPEELYQDLMGAIFFALVPAVVAGGLPALARDPRLGAAAHPAVRLLGRYLYALVLVIYLAILVAYTLRVAATAELPKNILSPIVLLAGLGGLLGALFLEPLQDDEDARGVARLVRVFPAVLLPLLPLPIWAVAVRQDQYGWTEFRFLRLVLLVALAVLAAWGTARLVRRRAPLLAPVPAALAAALLLASVGPWSAQAVSRRDQGERLRAALREAGLMRGGRLVRPLLPPGKSAARPDTIPAELYQRIGGAILYLRAQHGPVAVERALGAPLGAYAVGWPLMQALGVHEGCRRGGQPYLGASLPLATAIPVEAGTVLLVEPNRAQPAEFQNPGLVWVRLVGNTAVVEPRAGSGLPRLRADLSPMLRALAGRAAHECEGFRPDLELSLELARVPVVDSAGRARGTLLVHDVGFGPAQAAAGRPEPRPSLELDRVRALLFVRP